MASGADKAQLAAIQRELAGVVSTAVKGIATGFMDAAIETTPVDTGATQANWMASQRVPVADVVGDRSQAGVATARAAQTASRAQIATWKSGTLHVSNNESNVERINDGNTANAAGFVQRSIKRGIGVGGAKAAAAARAASRRGTGGR